MNWLDAEFWKRIAGLASSWQTIATSVLFFASLLWALVKWGFTPFRWLASKIRTKKKPAEQAPVKVAEQNAERRAYVMLDDEKPIERLRVAVGQEPTFLLRFKNFGLTPAYKIGVARSIASGPWPLPDNFDLTINSNESGGQVLAPGAVTYWGSTPHKGGMANVVTDEEMAKFKSGEHRIYIYGRLILR